MEADNHRQLTKISSGEPSPQSKNSSSDTAERIDSIALLLNRLALHCPVRNLPKGQNDLLMQDTITDLLPYHPQQVAEACEAWRRGSNPFFPISGQLIALIQKTTEQSIANARANRPAYRAPKMLEGPRKPLKSARQILAEHGRAMPVSHADAPPKPAQQETLMEDGSLHPQRCAELEELAARVADVALKGTA